VTASGAALKGNRTTIPDSKTTSTSGSATIRSGTNDADVDESDSPRDESFGSWAKMRRHPDRERLIVNLEFDVQRTALVLHALDSEHLGLDIRSKVAFHFAAFELVGADRSHPANRCRDRLGSRSRDESVLLEGGLRLRISLDEWEQLGLYRGQLVPFERHGHRGEQLLLAEVVKVPPIVWVVMANRMQTAA
jgi:hypothetical protein